MLAKAVRQHDAAPNHKPSTLKQQLFPSSSPRAGLEKSRTESPFVPPNKILRPSSSTVHNMPLPWERQGSVNSSRSGSVASSIGSKSDGIFFSKEHSLDFSQSTDLEYPTIGGGRVGKLHESVNFDDFPEDAELDLDEEEQDPWVLLPAPEAAQSSEPASTTPYPWSSSPLQHKQAFSCPNNSLRLTDSSAVTYPNLPKVPNIKAEQEQPIRSIELDSDNSFKTEPERSFGHIKVEPDQSVRPSKRRTLPWVKAEEQDFEEPRRGPPPHVQKIIEHQRGNHPPIPSRDEASVTPLPKDKSNAKYPWTITASAIKEDQKRLRQVNKRSAKELRNGEGDSTEVPKLSCEHVARVFLSDEQKKVLALVLERSKSVFYTGSAGTGKSVLMREIIKALKAKYAREPDRVAVTASTGLAACNVGGVTLHSFAGIGLGKEAIPDLVKKIKRNQKAKNRWMRTKVLIIDEISMVDGDLFDKLEGIARIIRNNGRPFGGIQLVITGDFFQLPPVPDYGKVAKFAFDAATWNTSIEHTIGLTQIFRQKDPGMYKLSHLCYDTNSLSLCQHIERNASWEIDSIIYRGFQKVESTSEFW